MSTITAKCLVEAQTAGSSASTVYTAASNTKVIIDKFTAQNGDSGSQTISVYIVGSGGSVGTTNLVINAKSLTTKQTYDFTELQNQILNAGDFISVLASVADKVVIRISGREIT